jgi:CheY-like chemotaxis protein
MESTRKKRILVVEDEETYSKLLERILLKSGQYEVFKASNGQEALDILKDKEISFSPTGYEIDCVLLDLKMPVMGGLEFLEKVREIDLDLKRFLPIVILSAYEDREKWLKAVDLDTGLVAGYLKKPYEKDDVLNTLAKIWEGELKELIYSTFQRGAERMLELDKESVHD